jgi:hypothetical protein
MAKEGQDFKMWAGSDKDIKITVIDPDDGSNILLTSATWYLKASEGGATLLTKTPTLTSGLATIALAAVDTDNLEGEYYHVLKGVSSGKTEIICTGTVYMEREQP